MGWRIVEVETDETIRLYLNNLMIRRTMGKILINISDIDTLILKNTRTNVSIRLLNALARGNVNVIVMDGMHEPNSYLVPVNGNHNSLKILEKQIEWTRKYKAKLWKSIIQNKLHNQKEVLSKYCQKNFTSYFDELIAKVRALDITNREGHAAKVYWNNIFNMPFQRDHKSERHPIINGMLNYGYAVLRSLVIRSIVKKGLDPRISLFHKSFSNFFALASDLMEPLRPLIDKIVYEHRNAPLFSYEIKDQLIGVLEQKVIFNDKKEQINNAIDKSIDNIISGRGWMWLELCA